MNLFLFVSLDQKKLQRRKTVYIYSNTYWYHVVIKMHCAWDIYTHDSVGTFKCFFHLYFKGTLRYFSDFQACYAHVPVPATMETSIYRLNENYCVGEYVSVTTPPIPLTLEQCDRLTSAHCGRNAQLLSDSPVSTEVVTFRGTFRAVGWWCL